MSAPRTKVRAPVGAACADSSRTVNAPALQVKHRLAVRVCVQGLFYTALSIKKGHQLSAHECRERLSDSCWENKARCVHGVRVWDLLAICEAKFPCVSKVVKPVKRAARAGREGRAAGFPLRSVRTTSRPALGADKAVPTGVVERQ